MTARLPRTLLNGWLRTSTLLLCLAYAAVLILYLQVRPPPADDGGTSPTRTTRSPEPARTSDTTTDAPTSTAAPSGTPSSGGAPAPSSVPPSPTATAVRPSSAPTSAAPAS